MEENMQINKKIIVTINMLSTMIIIFLFLIRDTFNFDFILLFLGIFMFICLFNYKSYLFLKYFSCIFYSTYMLIGLFICNNFNLYLYEIDKNTHYNGSFSLALIYFIIFFVSLIFFDKKFSKKFKYYLLRKEKKHSNYKTIDNYISTFTFIIGLIMLAFVFKNPSFSFNLDRFNYKSKYLPKWLSSLQSNYVYCIPWLLFPIICKNKKIDLKLIAKLIVVILPFIFYGIWTGNKFGLFFKIFILLISPITVYICKGNLKYNTKDDLCFNSNVSKKNNVKIRKTLFLTLLIFCLLLLPYYLSRNLNFSNSMLNRAAQQGQLWWATFEVEQGKEIRLNELNDEISPIIESIKGDSISDSYGIYKIMKLTTPYKIYTYKLSTGSRYAAQGIDIVFYYFKYYGIFVHAIIRAFVEAFLVNLLVKYVFSKRMIETYVICRLIIISHFIFTQGDIYMLFSKGSIFFILILIICNLLYKKNSFLNDDSL